MYVGNNSDMKNKQKQLENQSVFKDDDLHDLEVVIIYLYVNNFPNQFKAYSLTQLYTYSAKSNFLG